jgi:cytoskeletal protein CcmA (bactofilin family)
MFNLKSRDHLADPKDAGKSALKPALYDPPGSLARPVAPNALRPSPTPPAPGRESPPPAPALTTRDDVTQTAATAPASAIPSPNPVETAGSKLFVGVNIKLKGVEISDCDVLVIEGHVEATVHSQVMQIAKPGTLKGTALIDVAEVHGEFSGELTARKRLIVHGTGRVSGTIRYGQLIVAEGGEISGDVKRLEASDKQASAPRSPTPDPRHVPPQARSPLPG